VPPKDDDDDFDDSIDLDELAENMSLEDLLKDPESDLVPQVKPLLQDAYLDEMAHARLASDDERQSHVDQANEIEKLITSIDEGWEIPERASAIVRPRNEQVADELDRRRRAKEAERAAIEARGAEQARLEALSDQERAAEVGAAQETAAFEQQRRDFNDWMDSLVESGELTRAVNPFSHQIQMVPPGGHTPPSLQHVVDMFHTWHELPIHERERWFAERTQAERDALSVFYQVRPPADIDEIPALQESE
jgi:hypothetical protein